ncbi:MAG: hypothetical protein KKD56_10895 [Acidobacteria bacterium]|nr:hypothetical protein [Acidobacteriota bacterium]
MKKSGIVIALMLFCLAIVRAEDGNIRVFVFGGANHHFTSGTVDDYIQGGNDFPVTPAHRPVLFGFSYTRLFRQVGIEMDWRYSLPGIVTMEDPSDDDTVEIDTAAHMAISLNLLLRILSGRFSPYLLFGGGVDIAFPKTAVYTSSYGYEIAMGETEKKDRLDFEAHIGGGLEYLFTRSVGIRLDVRYSRVFDSPGNTQMLQATGGLILAF